MKNIRSTLGILALSGAFVVLPSVSVFASEGDPGGHVFETGEEFGQHISSHATMGHLGKDMNPGTHHKGFSPWAPGN